VPVWVAVAVGVLAAIALVDRLFSPALGWWLRRRANRAIDELNQRLRLKIPPFKLARRRQLIEQLLFDPDVLRAVEGPLSSTSPFRATKKPYSSTSDRDSTGIL
jgi:glycerol-3-phosphate O-acyltransferase